MSSYGDPESWASAPESMRRIEQWGVWGYSAEGAKIPRDLKRGRPADAHSDASVTTFEAAVQRAVALKLGLYFDLRATDPFVGVDLDDCMDDEGEVHPAARELARTLGGYCEVSPSGNGLKVTLEGDVPRAVPRRKATGPWGGGLEIYATGRFWAVTGKVLVP